MDNKEKLSEEEKEKLIEEQKRVRKELAVKICDVIDGIKLVDTHAVLGNIYLALTKQLFTSDGFKRFDKERKEMISKFSNAFLEVCFRGQKTLNLERAPEDRIDIFGNNDDHSKLKHLGSDNPQQETHPVKDAEHARSSAGNA